MEATCVQVDPNADGNNFVGCKFVESTESAEDGSTSASRSIDGMISGWKFVE
ncbi:MAG: hypothetical protein HC849_31515, partial [Oscillatoriales cyanobacterium RU_3_3]|nr:hypothetical protein [Oscillatoriales cyanobacterium RU_3_3]